MSVTAILGLILIIFGFGFLVRGLGGVFARFTPLSADPSGLDPISKLIDSITKLVTALTKAPPWLASTVIGLLLIVLGAWIGGWLPPLHAAKQAMLGFMHFNLS